MSRPLPRRGSTFLPEIKHAAIMRFHQGEKRKKLAQELGISEYRFHVWVCNALPQPEDYTRALSLLKQGANRHAVREAFGGKMPLSNLQITPFKRSKK